MKTGARNILPALLLLISAACLAAPVDGDTIAAADTPATIDAVTPAETAAPQSTDSIAAPAAAMADRNWWRLLWRGKLDLKDKTVEYPGAVRLFVIVYNWADVTFNSYDDDYVVGTGRRWKAIIKNDNWLDSYSMHLAKGMGMRMMSDPYCSVGAYLQYMAVSVGYSLDMSNIIGNKPANHKKFEFSFNCARFSIDAYYHKNDGGTYIRTFGDYRNGHIFKKEFPGLRLSNSGVDAYFFFNNRKYSQGAAYNFSKYQIRSAGSFIIGFGFTNLDINLDMSKLPKELLPYLKIPVNTYYFHYNNYSLILGYGYNWVFHKNWVLNVTALPLVGMNHCYEDSAESSVKLFSLGIKGRGAIVYNIGDFFLGLAGTIHGHWYNSSRYSLFSSIESISVSTGVRF